MRAVYTWSGGSAYVLETSKGVCVHLIVGAELQKLYLPGGGTLPEVILWEGRPFLAANPVHKNDKYVIPVYRAASYYEAEGS